MGRKSEKREQRKAEKLKQFEAAKPMMLEKAIGNDVPRLAHEPTTSDKPRVAPHIARGLLDLEKTVKIAPTSRWDKPVTFCITKKDVIGTWSWGEARQWTGTEWNDIIEPAFSHFCSLNWSEIDSHTSDTGHKNHHSHELSSLIDEAQERWRVLKLEEFDTLFRFRLGNTKRAWGFILQAHFHFVWWERDHNIYRVA